MSKFLDEAVRLVAENSPRTQANYNRLRELQNLAADEEKEQIADLFETFNFPLEVAQILKFNKNYRLQKTE